MAYLRLRDYSTLIQEANLLQIINSTDSFRLAAEKAAEAEAKSYLVQKYDVDSEFLDTEVYSFTKVYKAYALVELNFSDYNSATNYVLNDLVINNSKAYICTTPTTGTFNPAHWTLLGNKFDLFHILPPEKEFNYKNYYKKGDDVFWKDKTYTALIDTPALDHFTALQYGRNTNLPLLNVFPDDPIDGVKYWGTGTAFSVAAGTLPTNAAWTAGDNRSYQLVQKCIDLCLYHLHSRIAPRNIPQLRIDRYNAAIDWLKDCAFGNITADIPLLQPKKTGMIRIASDVKRQNDY